MGVQMETLLGVLRGDTIQKAYQEELEQEDDGPELHSWQREQEQPQVMLGSQNDSIGKPTNI